MSNSKLGIVFSGGGAKGAYQIGVWQALLELGIADKIVGVSGTSVGAINGVLFAQGDIRVGYEIWEKAKMEPIDLQNSSRTQKILSKLIGKGNYQAVYNIANNDCLSSKQLSSYITTYLDSKRLQEFPGDCFVTTHNMKTHSPVYFNLKKYPKEEQVKIVLASASIPYIFSSVKIEGKRYCDGGASDNTPILPLYRECYNPIIVVYLSKQNLVNVEDYPGCTIIQLTPSKSLGNFKTGTLNFDGNKIDQMMEQGYDDTMRAAKYLRSLQGLIPLTEVKNYQKVEI